MVRASLAYIFGLRHDIGHYLSIAAGPTQKYERRLKFLEEDLGLWVKLTVCMIVVLFSEAWVVVRVSDKKDISGTVLCLCISTLRLL